MKLTMEEAKRLMQENDGNLDLRETKVTELPDNLTVRGWLDLSGTGITTLPNNLTVKNYLDLRYTKITELPNDLTVGGLELSGTGIRNLPDNLTVGGGLDISDTGIADLPNNLTVAVGLDLTGTDIATLPDNLKVGVMIFGRNGRRIENEKYRLQEGDYVPGRYLYVDRYLTHVKRKKKIGPYDYYVGKIPGENVISDGTNYAHCQNLCDGIRDLAFKRAKDRGADQYRGLTLDSVLPTGEMITMYRVITGVCQQGIERFLESLGTLKESYSIREVVELTQGQYGAETFRTFFN